MSAESGMLIVHATYHRRLQRELSNDTSGARVLVADRGQLADWGGTAAFELPEGSYEVSAAVSRAEADFLGEGEHEETVYGEARTIVVVPAGGSAELFYAPPWTSAGPGALATTRPRTGGLRALLPVFAAPLVIVAIVAITLAVLAAVLL
ncbi:hypothetical protein [Allokutzneria sp. NRRL B-24872]|uniref:hypothetical protein n=1 Tax=Allokutzneria sp. NRRL B-24872 TaxID=1137961 RepID=UPI0011785433|nr:hypothetical protein [Allokutzneria sp. NRRL B-24872]